MIKGVVFGSEYRIESGLRTEMQSEIIAESEYILTCCVDNLITKLIMINQMSEATERIEERLH